MKINKRILFAICLCLSLCFTSCSKKEDIHQQDKKQTEQKTNQDNRQEKTAENKIALYSAFSKFTTVDLDKNEYTQDILKDKKLTVLNIWSTFCGPCVKEMPVLAKLSEEYKYQDVQFIGLVADTLDQNGNYSDQMIDIAKQLIETSEVKYLNLLPSTDLINSYLYQVDSIPQTLILDSNGNILKEIVGAQTKDVFSKIIDDELKKLK